MVKICFVFRLILSPLNTVIECIFIAITHVLIMIFSLCKFVFT